MLTLTQKPDNQLRVSTTLYRLPHGGGAGRAQGVTPTETLKDMAIAACCTVTASAATMAVEIAARWWSWKDDGEERDVP